ncbi:MAG: hypothetical protein JO019_01425 [Candidatus Kaiserbacteria bacterium]|nr:hypothetical protein [Candidatus Kaiserbacteria bacterium]
MSDGHAAPPQHTPPRNENRTVIMISNILAIVGFLILIVIIIWGLLHIASLSSGAFSGIFKTQKSSTVSVSAPASSVSGQPVKISWNYSTNDTGRYAFLYECTPGLDFGAPVMQPGTTTVSLVRIPCGASFTLGNATSSIILVPVLSTTTPKTAQMTIIFMASSNSTQAHGTAKMTVNPGMAPVATSTTPSPKPEREPSPTPTPSPSPEPTPRPTGPADLKVSILSISTDPSGFSTAVFDISNIGNSSTGTYYFTATLPTAQPYTFYSQPQASLTPGSHIVNTLRFSQTVNGVFSVVVDPQNMVPEANEGNNSISQPVYYAGYNPSIPYQTY